MHCDEVKVQPRFNFSDEIIILNLDGEEGREESGGVQDVFVPLLTTPPLLLPTTSIPPLIADASAACYTDFLSGGVANFRFENTPNTPPLQGLDSINAFFVVLCQSGDSPSGHRSCKPAHLHVRSSLSESLHWPFVCLLISLLHGLGMMR